eukprot:GCRY01002160.1.p1 GENE.GCRY01002160.1~~GCRY01002160.1.p1  ORF type:complete len:126 (-),score=36.00 GCRY01002160.1:31-408(-)
MNGEKLPPEISQQLSGSSGPSEEQMAQQQAQKAQMEEKRRFLLNQILSPEASSRLSTLSLVKPEKARSVEDTFLQMAQRGALQGQVSEQMVVQMLKQGGESTRTKMTINRRRYAVDSDESDDDDW